MSTVLSSNVNRNINEGQEFSAPLQLLNPIHSQFLTIRTRVYYLCLWRVAVSTTSFTAVPILRISVYNWQCIISAWLSLPIKAIPFLAFK
jgi:hypothetical protein